MATVELVPGEAEASAARAATRPRVARPQVAAATVRPEPGGRSAAEEGASAEATGRLRAVVLLVLFLLGCALAAVGAALAVGALWQEVYAWVMPQVVGDMLVA